MSIPSLLLCARLILLLNVPDLSSAKPAPYRNVPHSHNHLSNGVYTNETSSGSQPSSYWVANIERRGAAAFNPDPTGYPVYRNVKDYGAVGDGHTDDIEAINRAIADGHRCGRGCDSSTVSPALVYFPPGTYRVSTPIIQYYYTQLVGDAINLPTLKATANFSGIAVVDANPYDETGRNWYTNQNNFFRQIRNFVIDVTEQPPETGTGLHWQVAQATSLQNIRFEMRRGGADNKQQGIFMENGSGGFMGDLVFDGGRYGAFFGNQQFISRNLTFNGCQTAIFMNWNWLWTFKSLSIHNCEIGIDMANGGQQQQLVGSVLVQDSSIETSRAGILTSFSTNSTPVAGGTLVIDNVEFRGSGAAVANPLNVTVVPGSARVASWAQGREYRTDAAADGIPQGVRAQGPLEAETKPGSLVDGGGAVFERSKPQYEQHPASAFVSVKANGAKGDGRTDDTAAIQAVLDRVAATPHGILYFDHGSYVVSDTVRVPKDIKITGEAWAHILASGAAFGDESQPRPVFQVGRPGDVGAVEMSDLVFATAGPQPGAVMVEWNVRDATQGACGMWDVHMRIGGSAGTQLQSDRCAKTPNVTTSVKPECVAAALLLHVTRDASIYLENNWIWVADHELDRPDYGQINIYNGRGILVESQGPVWMYAVASEHHQLYNYQFVNAKDVYMATIQSETPYYQANPNALTPFTSGATFSDPGFGECTTDRCRKAWGLRLVDSSSIYMYGAGLYSFFDNYGQTCLDTESCQENMVGIERSSVQLFGLGTKAATNMIRTPSGQVVRQEDNRSNFCSTLALFDSTA